MKERGAISQRAQERWVSSRTLLNWDGEIILIESEDEQPENESDRLEAYPTGCSPRFPLDAI
jgi:hypothetical protein